MKFFISLIAGFFVFVLSSYLIHQLTNENIIIDAGGIICGLIAMYFVYKIKYLSETSNDKKAYPSVGIKTLALSVIGGAIGIGLIKEDIEGVLLGAFFGLIGLVYFILLRSAITNTQSDDIKASYDNPAGRWGTLILLTIVIVLFFI